MPASPVRGTVGGVYRRLLVLLCFAGLALGVAYVGTGVLEDVLRSARSETARRVESLPPPSADVSTQSTPPASVSAPDQIVTDPGVVASSPSTSGAAVQGFAPAVAADVVARLNTERLAAGLSALRVDETLAAEAAAWAEQMTRNGYVHSTHDRLVMLSNEFGGGGMAENLHAPEVQCAAALSCDLDDARPTSGVLHVDWMRSSSHRSTMLDPAWDRVGVGVYCDAAGRMWATALFVAPAGVAVSGDDVVPYREPSVSGNDGVTCTGSTRAHNPRWQHTPVS